MIHDLEKPETTKYNSFFLAYAYAYGVDKSEIIKLRSQRHQSTIAPPWVMLMLSPILMHEAYGETKDNKLMSPKTTTESLSIIRQVDRAVRNQQSDM